MAPRVDSFDEGVADGEAELTAALARAQAEGVDGDHGGGGECHRLDLGLGFGENRKSEGREREQGLRGLRIHQGGGHGSAALGRASAAWRQ